MVWPALIGAVGSIGGALLSSKGKKAAPEMPMFGAPRLAPGVYQAATAKPAPMLMPEVGPDPAAAQPQQQPGGIGQIDAKALLQELLNGQTRQP